VLVMSAALRDLHRRPPGFFLTDVCTSVPELWENNPYITKLSWRALQIDEPIPAGEELKAAFPRQFLKISSADLDLKVVDVSVSGDTALAQGEKMPDLFEMYCLHFSKLLRVEVRLSEPKGDIHLSKDEICRQSKVQEIALPEKYWLIFPGGPLDYSTSWWDPRRYQEVVDHFQGKINFVQVGRCYDWNSELKGVVNVSSFTMMRELIRLMHHADGVLCSTSLPAHLAAAVPMHDRDHQEIIKGAERPCVVIAGGRSLPGIGGYRAQQHLSVIGQLPCCATAGCGKRQCRQVGEAQGSAPDTWCVAPVDLSATIRYPRCQDLITSQMVIDKISNALVSSDSLTKSSLPSQDRGL
jgi:hypothetical protein